MAIISKGLKFNQNKRPLKFNELLIHTQWSIQKRIHLLNHAADGGFVRYYGYKAGHYSVDDIRMLNWIWSDDAIESELTIRFGRTTHTNIHFHIIR